MAANAALNGQVGGRRAGAGRKRWPLPVAMLRAAQTLQRRLQFLDLTPTDVARMMDLDRIALLRLLHGQQRTYAPLGYDQWPERLSVFLDSYEQAQRLVQERAVPIRDELVAAKLPIPPALAALLPPGKRIKPSVTPVRSSKRTTRDKDAAPSNETQAESEAS